VLRIAFGDSPRLGEGDGRVLKPLRSAVNVSKDPQIVRQTQLSPGCPQIANACDTILDIALPSSATAQPFMIAPQASSAETKSQRPDLLQPVSVSRAESGRTVLQQDQAMSTCRDPI